MDIVDLAINVLIEHGIVTIVAAGNSGVNACNISPARVLNAITIASSTEYDTRSIFNNTQSSNFGSCVDIFAPGSDITSAWIGESISTNKISGTSMAAPHAAGVVAKYLEKYPNATVQNVRDYIIENSTKNVMSGLDEDTPNRLLFSTIEPEETPEEIPVENPSNEDDLIWTIPISNGNYLLVF